MRPQGSGRYWHVTLTVGGAKLDPFLVRQALNTLGEQYPFLDAVGAERDRAELRYWDEAASMDGAVAMALHLWAEHREPAGLPAWEVLGLHVVDRSLHQQLSGPLGVRS